MIPRLPSHSPARLILFGLGLMLALPVAAGAKRYPTPDRLSYEGIPGFDPALAARKDSPTQVLEWSHPDREDGSRRAVSIPSSLNPRDLHGLKIRWLGTAGFEISDDETVILVDPFVSRPNAAQFNTVIATDTQAVDQYVMEPIPLSHLKVILNAHAHHDHVQDIPYILSKYPRAEDRPTVVGTKNVPNLLKSYTKSSWWPFSPAWLKSLGKTDGLDLTPQVTIEFDKERKLNPPPDESLSFPVGSFGKFKITAFVGEHPPYDYFGLKLEGVMSDGLRPPFSGFRYLTYLQSSLAYLIEYQDSFTIFVSESPFLLHAERIGKEIGTVDLLLQGIASRLRGDQALSGAIEFRGLYKDHFIHHTLTALRPRYVVPSHYDDFFRPIKSMNKLSVRIGAGPIYDFSRFAEFLRAFEPFYVAHAREIVERKEGPDASLSWAPRLRLLKLLYYYSLDDLIEKKATDN